MEEFSLAAFLCDGNGQLCALSPCAETLLASGDHLTDAHTAGLEVELSAGPMQGLELQLSSSLLQAK